MYSHGDDVEYRLWDGDEWKTGVVYAVTSDVITVYIGDAIVFCHPNNVRKPK